MGRRPEVTRRGLGICISAVKSSEEVEGAWRAGMILMDDFG